MVIVGIHDLIDVSSIEINRLLLFLGAPYGAPKMHGETELMVLCIN